VEGLLRGKKAWTQPCLGPCRNNCRHAMSHWVTHRRHMHRYPASSRPCAVCIVDPPQDIPSCILNPCSPFIPSELSDFIMSSTGQATSSDSSPSNIQLIIDALADYAKVTGIDLSKNPFAATIEQSSSPEAILQLLQGRENAFKEYRDGNRRLISCLSPAVNVLQAFSGILGEAVSLVSHSCHLVSFFLA
jgi:hypothetical protein